MGKIWVRCRGRVYYEEHGLQKVGEPGDWIQVGKYQARELLAQGIAEIPDPYRRAETRDFSKNGIVVRANELPHESVFGGLQHALGEPSLPYDYTILWEPSLPATVQAFEVGLIRLSGTELASRDSWEILATLVDESSRASDVGSAEEQHKTEEVVGDLRIPVYDTRLLWIRKNMATEELVEKWAAELAEGADERHAFLRALYSSRVMMCTLPPDWQNLQARWHP